jgi:CxxC motif-containing protein
MEKNIICTVCPRGCHVKVTLNGTEVTDVADYGCKRGKEYATAEATHPVRILTTTVKIAGNRYNLLPVRSNAPVPKELQMECMKAIKAVTVTAPVNAGDVVLANICNTGVDIVATKAL